MGKDLVRGAIAGLALGPALGQPVSRLYDEDIEQYTVMPMVLLSCVLAFPVGWLLARLLRITHPIRTALLGPVLLLVGYNALDAALPDARPRPILLGVIALAVLAYASAAALTRTVSLVPRIVAAVVVCACVITTSTVEQRRAEAWEREHRADLIALYKRSVPLVLPVAVPGRTLVSVGTITDEVLSLDYAEDAESEPDVFVRIRPDEDPRKACQIWVRHSGSCRRLAAGRWMTEKEKNGRLVLFAKVDRWLVEVDSTALRPDDLVVVGTRLRPVTAEYLVDHEPL
ncbi:hypothetical protein HII36_51070 [Nonomuraea sp. NN258]|uniref:hypothetical protein n=1 Tax=Nonomuraea antri TaxID=2730852 RepID=UPI00156948D5|nr:hypothetical protein [Nonomuraea antri]NRQ40114.1 hypothetical protein [Nonomuraea antri]